MSKHIFNKPNEKKTNFMDEEISLYDIWSIVVQRKKIVIPIFIFVVSIVNYFNISNAVSYSKYSAEAYFWYTDNYTIQLFSRLEKKINRINSYLKSDIKIRLPSIRKKILVARVVNRLNSEAYINKYLDLNGTQLRGDLRGNALNSIVGSRLKVAASKGAVKVTLESFTDESDLESWLNNIVEGVDNQVIDAHVKVITGSIEALNDVVEDRLSSLRKIVRQERKDKVVQLEEKYSMAAELNIQNATLHNEGVEYLLGMKILRAKINALKNRKSDDPYIFYLRKLQAEILDLESIEINKNKLRALTIIQPAKLLPPVLVEAKLQLKFFFSFVVAGILGILAALMADFFIKRGARLKEIKN